jgi:hypothetical protein
MDQFAEIVDGEDIIGALEIVDGESDIVGALVKAARQDPTNGKLASYARQAVRMRKAAAGHLVDTSGANKSRMYPLGFDSGAVIAAAAAAGVVSQAQINFRPDRLAIAATVAPNFLINGITIGQGNQFVAAVPIPAECFSQLAVGVEMHMDTAQVSQNITINVTNFSLAASRFLATLIGPVVLQ